MKQPTNDYRVFEDVTHTGEVRWIIRAGGAGGVMISTYVDKQNADTDAGALNLDPWYFERGQTKSDRIAADILAARKS